MQNLKYLKVFFEENKAGVYTEVNLISKATVRPPCLILEPIRNKKASKNKVLNFRAIFIDIEVPYNGILEFGKRTEEILDYMETHEVFEGNFELLNREIIWDLFESENMSYYKAIAEYEIDSTTANKDKLEEYVMMKTLEVGGITNGDA